MAIGIRDPMEAAGEQAASHGRTQEAPMRIESFHISGQKGSRVSDDDQRTKLWCWMVCCTGHADRSLCKDSRTAPRQFASRISKISTRVPDGSFLVNFLNVLL